MLRSATARTPAGRRTRLVLAFTSFVLIGVSAGVGGVLIPTQATYYGVAKITIALAFATLSIGYVVAGAAVGALLRRYGPRGTVVLGLALFTLGTVGGALRPSYAGLVVVSLVIGLGTGVLDAGLNAYVATLDGHTALLNYLHACFGAGALVGPVLAVTILDAGAQWNMIYLALAVPAVPLVLAFAWAYPGPDPTTVRPARSEVSLLAAVRHRGIQFATLFLGFAIGIEAVVGTWGYSFLTLERDQGPVLAGWLVSAFWGGFTLGRFVLNAVAERFGVGPVALTWLCLAGSTASICLAWLPPAGTTIAGLVLLGFCSGPLVPLTVAVMPRIAPRDLVSTAIGLLIAVGVVGGAGFPLVAGALGDAYGLGTLMPYALALTLVSVALWLSVVNRMAPDTPEASEAGVATA